ncbi:DUF3426 domain-containing protein [Acinetobacter sp. YH12112]|uniref:DUF3426 domain-containing protein n=1 Tax=Acinetobacter sp. YH12112 TaxID=2601099 RepID=UPI0015D235BF|nr:DUF3426 domain-containing protein [Acinetobacter sp. YH12112]
MSEKQTKCPECLTTYKVSVAQLTVAQGMVCCPKCASTFNALSHLVQPKPAPTQLEYNGFTGGQVSSPVLADHGLAFDDTHETHLLDIFDRKVEHSNIDLKTYLNNLNYFSTEPIASIPSMNLSENELQQERKKHGAGYYTLWGIVNFSLVGLLIFQILWFNPKFMNNSPALTVAFNRVCQLFNCETFEKQYSLISINRVRVKRYDHEHTLFSGELINFHDKSLVLPKLKITLKDDNEEVATYVLEPKEYLIKSLASIERIPKNTPFKFEIQLPVTRKSFDTYNLEIIKP